MFQLDVTISYSEMPSLPEVVLRDLQLLRSVRDRVIDARRRAAQQKTRNRLR